MLKAKKNIILILMLFFSLFSNLYSKKNRRTFVITTTHSMPPYSFYGKNETPDGIVIDFWKLWAKKNNVKVKFILTSWNESLNNVKNGAADFHAGLYKSESRAKFLIFSKGFFKYTLSVFVSSRLNVSSFNGLIDSNIPIGITRGSYAVEYLKSNYKKMKLNLYSTNKTLLQDAVKADILSFAVDYSVAYYYLSKFDSLGDFRLLSDLVTKEFRAGVKKGNEKLMLFINQGLIKINQREIEGIFNKWVVKKYKIPEWLKNVLVFGGVGLIIIFLVLQWVLLKIEINRKTVKLKEKQKILDVINKDMREANLTVQSRIEYLENINKAKDDSIQMISERLRFSLTDIKELMEKTGQGESSLNELNQRVSGLINLVDKLLHISQIEHNEYKSRMEKKNLSRLINSRKKEFKKIALNKNINLSVSILSSKAVSYVNEQHFNEILSNLITNAVKFTNPGGEVFVELDLKEVSHEKKCVISVKDTGEGIKKENLPYIFNSKTNLNKIGTKGEWTTGISLAIVKKFVELHNGYIEVDSEENTGSVFTVYLPAITEFHASFDEVKHDLHTGDIFLFKGVDKPGLDIFGEYINWTHVAMVVRFPEKDEVLLWESTDLETVFDKKFNKMKKGPQLVSIHERLKTYKTDLFALRKLKVALTQEMLKNLFNFIREVHPLPFPGDFNIISRFLRNKFLGWLFKRKRKYKDIFCSELVAETYIKMGLFSESENPGSYLPSDFSSGKVLPFLKGAYLGPEIFINFD